MQLQIHESFVFTYLQHIDIIHCHIIDVQLYRLDTGCLFIYRYTYCTQRMKIVSRLADPIRFVSAQHYDDVIMSTTASQITNLTIIYSTVYSGADQRNIKAPSHWPLWGELTGDRWIPRTKGQQRGNSFHLMTSWWNSPKKVSTFIPFSVKIGCLMTQCFPQYWTICAGNQSVICGFPCQRTSNVLWGFPRC